MLNFSIAYGKTAHGLSKDFKTSLEEAQETVNKWYADRPEVRSAGAAMQGLLLCRALRYALCLMLRRRRQDMLYHKATKSLD